MTRILQSRREREVNNGDDVNSAAHSTLARLVSVGGVGEKEFDVMTFKSDDSHLLALST